MTVAELRTLLSTLDDDLPIHVDMYDGKYLLTHGRAESAGIAESALRLKAAKHHGEGDDVDQLCDLMDANAWKGEPTHCSHAIVRKKVPGFCRREVECSHDGKPWCDRHYPPAVEHHQRLRREHDERIKAVKNKAESRRRNSPSFLARWITSLPRTPPSASKRPNQLPPSLTRLSFLGASGKLVCRRHL